MAKKSAFFQKVGTGKRARSGVAFPGTAPDPPSTQEYDTGAKGALGRRWSVSDGAYWQAKESCKTIPSGVYMCELNSNVGAVFSHIEFDIDSLIELPDTASNEVLAEIKEFWKLKSEFKARGFTHKNGILLWGPPGSGKSSLIQLLITAVIKDHDGIGIMIQHPGVAIQCLQMFRKIEPDRPVVALLEDFDALVERHGETEFLALLDGEARIGNIIFVAATNYPERLDARFVDRPSRFSVIKEIGMPTAAARRVYLQTKEPSLAGDELDQWVEASDGFSIDHLRELIVLCRCHRKPLEQALERLNAMRDDRPNSGKSDDGRHKALGFR